MGRAVRKGMIIGGIVSLIMSAGALLLAAALIAALISVVAVVIGAAVGGVLGGLTWLAESARAILRI